MYFYFVLNKDNALTDAGGTLGARALVQTLIAKHVGEQRDRVESLEALQCLLQAFAYEHTEQTQRQVKTSAASNAASAASLARRRRGTRRFRALARHGRRRCAA